MTNSLVRHIGGNNMVNILHVVLKWSLPSFSDVNIFILFFLNVYLFLRQRDRT